MADRFRSSQDVIVRTPGLQRAIDFYQSVLGLKTFHRDQHLVGFETGAFRLYVENGATHGPVFEFYVPDVQEAKRRLLAAGCVLVEEDPAVPRCYIRDPYGLTFNLARAPE